MKLKYLICLPASLFLIGCSGLNQSSSLREQTNPVQDVTLLEDKWMGALVEKDTAVLSSILAPAFTLSAGSPEIETRQQYLQTAAMPERKLQPVVLEDRHFQVFEETVISTGKTTYKGEWKTNKFNIPVRYTTVYVKQGDSWKAAAMHFSTINQ